MLGRNARIHGGCRYKGIIDFSSPQSPLEPPHPLKELLLKCVEEKVYMIYPDHSYTSLRKAIAHFYHMDYNKILPLNGSAELLSLLIPAYRPSRLISIEPNFGDHHLMSRALDLEIIDVPYVVSGDEYLFPIDRLLSLPKSLYHRAIIVFSNPNNPSGCFADYKLIYELLHYLPDSSVVVLDEAFIEFIDDVPRIIDDHKLILLRSFTKIFSTPGLRLGFAYINNARLLEKMELIRQPWNVSSIADCVFSRLLGSDEYISELRAYIEHVKRIVANERIWLTEKLSSIGLTVYRSHAPFILVKHPMIKHPYLQRLLIGKGFYIRDASSFKYLSRNHSRISVRLRKDNVKLVEALKEIIEGSRC